MSKGKILVIDDSPLVRKLLEVSLQEAGYEVQTAENGEDGLFLAESNHPDLILLNFIMPKMTGAQFCSALKENQNLRNTPVILITGKGESVGKSFIEKYGIQDYFLKPFKTEEIIEKVNELLSKGMVLDQEKIEPQIFTERDLQKEEEITQESSEIIVESEIKFPVEEEIQLSNLEEFTFEEKPKEKTIEIPIEKETMIPFQETHEEKTEELIEEPKEKEDLGLIISEGLDIETSPLIEEKIEEEIKISYEPFESSEVIEEQKVSEPQIPIIEEEKIYTPPPRDFEKIMEEKFTDFSQRISAIINYSIENLLKKLMPIKESNIILSGKTKYFDLKSLIKEICNSNVTGFLHIFGENITFEFLFIEGKIVYGITNKHKANLGNKLLKDFKNEEIENVTKESLSLLFETKTEKFIIEEWKDGEEFLERLPRYNIEELI